MTLLTELRLLLVQTTHISKQLAEGARRLYGLESLMEAPASPTPVETANQFFTWGYYHTRRDQYFNKFNQLALVLEQLRTYQHLLDEAQVQFPDSLINQLKKTHQELLPFENLEKLSTTTEVEALFQPFQTLNQLLPEIIALPDYFLPVTKLLDKRMSLVLKDEFVGYRGQLLFHGVKFEYAQNILERGSILGYTSQRYWTDGRRRKETETDYEDSFWMKGISMTRDINFALGWAGVVLVFDRTKITQSHEITPYAWNYHMKEAFGHAPSKREREDFVVLAKTNRKFLKLEDPEFMKEYHEIMNDPRTDPETEEAREYYRKASTRPDLDGMKDPEGEFNFTKKNALVGIILAGSTVDIYGLENPTIQMVINHPKFLGIKERDRWK